MNPLVCRLALNPLSHTSQGRNVTSLQLQQDFSPEILNFLLISQSPSLHPQFYFFSEQALNPQPTIANTVLLPPGTHLAVCLSSPCLGKALMRHRQDSLPPAHLPRHSALSLAGPSGLWTREHAQLLSVHHAALWLHGCQCPGKLHSPSGAH